MKKGIIVLLIAVLVSGFAFADLVTPGKITGSAGIEFSVDLNDKDSNAHAWGFANPRTAKYSFKFEFDSAKVAIGEDHQTDIWAELAAEVLSVHISSCAGRKMDEAQRVADWRCGRRFMRDAQRRLLRWRNRRSDDFHRSFCHVG